jgi:hypothetical protein
MVVLGVGVQESVTAVPAALHTAFKPVGVVGMAAATVMVTGEVAVVVEPEQVSVYVVVTAGETEIPVVLEVATLPMPLSILHDVALVDVHVSVEDAPATIEIGFAESNAEAIGAVTFTV